MIVSILVTAAIPPPLRPWLASLLKGAHILDAAGFWPCHTRQGYVGYAPEVVITVFSLRHANRWQVLWCVLKLFQMSAIVA
jgi:hypothetical protein